MPLLINMGSRINNENGKRVMLFSGSIFSFSSRKEFLKNCLTTLKSKA
jgi:hypothetical protein